MNSEQQYIDIFTGCREMLDSHSAGAMNALRDKAFEDFTRQGFPTQKVERYKYTDVPAAFAPDYGLNLNRVEFPVNPYEAFRCDVPNLSTSLYFVVNDAFYRKSLPAAALPEGVVVCSLKQAAEDYPDRVSACYGKLARTEKDAINALNTMLAQDGLFIYVPRGVVVERTLQVVNILRSDVDRQSLRGLPVRRAEPEHFALFCGERRFLPEVAAGRRVARRRGGMLPEAGGRGLSRPGVGLLRQTGPYGERRD